MSENGKLALIRLIIDAAQGGNEDTLKLALAAILDICRDDFGCEEESDNG